jgi:internalin A
LAQLKALDLDNNPLVKLPEEIGELRQLIFLNVNACKLTSLPSTIGKLKHLRRLEAANNEIDILPEAVGRIGSLNKLYLYNNRLQDLPESLSHLHSLESLSLSSNPLARLPDSIGKLMTLTCLALAHTKLRDLPESFRKLTKLQYLSLGNSHITRLPLWFGELNSLVGLDLSNNDSCTLVWEPSYKSWTQTDGYVAPEIGLMELPESFRRLQTLRELYLHGNSALGLPAEILGPSLNESFRHSAIPAAKPADILGYYFKGRANSRPLNEAKLILVGRGGVGKTCIVKRLLDNIFDRQEPKTDGISIKYWNITLREAESARLNVWDFGGQEIMHSTHQFFLTPVACTCSY